MPPIPPPHLIEKDREVFNGGGTLLPECRMVGWSRFERASLSLGPHAHTDSYEICYIVRGSVEWWAQAQVFDVGPRDLFVTRPGEAHGGVDAFMHPCELYWLLVRPVNALFQQLAGLNRRHFKGGGVMAEGFERLLSELRDPDAHSMQAARSELRLLVIDTLRFHDIAQREASRPAAPSAPIALAMDYIRAHFPEPACLAEAARLSGLQGTQFRKRFLQESGFAPHDYLARAQIQEAKRRLTHTAQPVTEMAFDLGFSSSQYFATAFRKLTGLTPVEYRRHRRE